MTQTSSSQNPSDYSRRVALFRLLLCLRKILGSPRFATQAEPHSRVFALWGGSSRRFVRARFDRPRDVSHGQNTVERAQVEKGEGLGRVPLLFKSANAGLVATLFTQAS